MVACFIAAKCETSGNTKCAESVHSDRGDEGASFSGGAALNAAHEDAVGAARREESETISPDPRWTLSEYCWECANMMDVGRFGAGVLGSKNLVTYHQHNL